MLRVETPLLNLGWKRITDRHNEYFKLKWTECKSQINYGLFREGEQLVNHIPNCNLLTNKLGLLTSLQEHNRVTQGMKSGGRIRMEDFVPETYRLDERGDKKTFLETYKDGEVWICKPTGMNQGKGIFLISTREEIDNIIKTREEKKQSIRNTSRPMMTRIIQRYIKNPLLLDGHKFDIRAYLHIASTVPYVVLYHKGYIRRTCQPYENDITNLAVHLTNQFVQKKVEAYKENKDDTVWSMEQFNDYINEKVVPEKEGLIENDWAANVLPKLMQKIMMYCFNSVKHKLQQRLGYFELFGFDFMIDDDMRVWLIEVNTNPALHTNCEVLKEVLPPIVEESLLISVECFEKKKKSQPVLPIQAVKGYNLMYHDDHRSAGAGSSLVTGPPIVPRCVSSMQRAAKPKEPTKESVETKSKDDEKEASEVKPSEKQDETNDDQSSDKQTVDTSAKNEQVAMNSSVEKSEKPVQVTSKSFSSITNILTSSSNVSMPNPAAAANAYGIRSRISGTNTKVTKSGWPSFMNKVSPRTLSSGSNPVSLTPVTLNVGSVAMATPISLKMTHAHSANAKTNRHKPIVNRRLVNNVNPKSTRAKSTMEDRSS